MDDNQGDPTRASSPEERAHIAQRAGGVATFEWDLESDEWAWTPQLAVLMGRDPGTALISAGDWAKSIFVDDVPKMRLAAAEAAAAADRGYYAEFRVKHPDGRLHWVAGKGETARDENGRARWICGVHYDITERKELQARLLAVNETLEARVAEVREEARTLEILNQTGTALAAELGIERLVQKVTDAAVEITGAQFGAFFYNVLNESGEAYTLYTISGVPREAFEKFPMPRNTAVFDPTFKGAGIVRSDDIRKDPRYGKNPPHHGMPKGHLPVVSYLAVPVVSRSSEVLGGLFFGHPEPGRFTKRHELIVNGIAAQSAVALDNARLYDASRREIAARRDAEKELQRVNETLEERVAEEVAERQQMEEALRQAQKMEAVGQLTGGIAHDFNNLLTVIIGNLEQMGHRLGRDHELQRQVAAAKRGASRAAILTQQLLAFSRRQPLAPKPAVLNKLLAGMSDLLQRTLGESIAVETVLAGGLWTTFVDVNQLENALINLAINARDAMPEGGRLTIETANCHLDDAYAAMHRDVRQGQYVGIFVTDTGAGMSEDVLAKAFDPFFTTKEIGQGTGLGLSQVYGFAKQSGGHVKLYSEIGQGTTVKLYFPRHQTKEAAEEPQPEFRPLPRAKAGEVVLVVEDDPDVRSYTTEIVRDLGYAVFDAADGQSALRVLADRPDIRLLFTDVGLPGGMNGRQLADETKRRWPNIKVLFTTGYARNAIVHHGRLDAGVEVVLKPFSYSDVALKLRRVFDT